MLVLLNQKAWNDKHGASLNKLDCFKLIFMQPGLAISGLTSTYTLLQPLE
jgi:hypothetical protein